jgi:hypothetical protein
MMALHLSTVEQLRQQWDVYADIEKMQLLLLLLPCKLHLCTSSLRWLLSGESQCCCCCFFVLVVFASSRLYKPTALLLQLLLLFQGCKS